MSFLDTILGHGSQPKPTLVIFDAHAEDLLRFKRIYSRNYAVTAVLVAPDGSASAANGIDAAVHSLDEAMALLNQTPPQCILCDSEIKAEKIAKGQDILREAAKPNAIPSAIRVLHTAMPVLNFNVPTATKAATSGANFAVVSKASQSSNAAGDVFQAALRVKQGLPPQNRDGNVMGD